MPTVKRFRTLGSLKKIEENGQAKKDITPVKRSNKVQRFQTYTEVRKRRSDRKHRFSLRIAYKEWDRVKELSLNCGGPETGASLNVIVNKLLLYALEDENCINKILSEYPSRPEYIAIRTRE